MGKRVATEMHLGNKEVYQVRQGEALVYAKQLTVSQTLDGVTSDAPSSVAWGDGLAVVLTADSDTQMSSSSVVVMMGGVDITSTAYDSATNTISIASVTGNVAITAAAAIIFEDAAVKAICAANWGGTIAGELTKNEAAAVTSLDDKFRNNTTITKFNEFVYFTGINTLYSAFSGCSNLEEITFPTAYLDSSANTNGRFTNVLARTKVVNVDMSNITTTNTRQSLVVVPQNAALKKVVFPQCNVDTMYYMLQGCTNLEEVDFSLCNFANMPATSNNRGTTSGAFYQTGKITTVRGGFPNLARSVNVNTNPISVESATTIITSLLSSPVSGATFTFKASMKATYEANADFNAAVATARSNGWTIAYS